MFFPEWCFQCHKLIIKEEGHPSSICKECYNALPWVTEPLNIDKIFQDSQKITQAYAIFTYEENIRKWIIDFKYYRNIFTGRLLRNLIHSKVIEIPELYNNLDYILPVPINRWRFIKRGFNQTELLLPKIGKDRIIINAILRKNTIIPQANLNRKQRLKNIKQQFQIKNLEQFRNKKILLFDDVLTTGATLQTIIHQLTKVVTEIRILVAAIKI